MTSAKHAFLPKREFTIGIEEEFFLVDAATFDCVEVMPEAFSAEIETVLGEHVKREVISSMIEIVSSVHSTVGSAIAELTELRRATGEIAARHGLTLLATGTHPFSDWRDQRLTPKKRYRAVADSLQALSKRVHVCGLHVHVGITDASERIDLSNRVQRFLPLLLALSTSSPFWRGEPTGLKGYRTAINNENPRSGLPGWFASADEYERYVRKLVDNNCMPDASFLWWAIRPSSKYATLELRVADSCTLLRDSGAVAALYQSLLHHLKYNPASCREWEHHHRLINDENMWQALRYGTDAQFIDPVSGDGTTVASMARDLTSLVSESAERLGCLREILCAVDIISGGTSADAQLDVFEKALDAGSSREEAVRSVARMLAERTLGKPGVKSKPCTLVAV